MKLFKATTGHIIAFGFDLVRRVPDCHMISWSDLSDGQWERYRSEDFVIAPEFVRDIDGMVMAYQPGLCIEMLHVGFPNGWEVKFLRAE